MIRRIDELLAEKTNKIALLELEDRIGKKFLLRKQWEELNDQFTVIANKMNV